MKEYTKIYIGTSGWSYNDWADGVFYPPDISNRGWLEYYSRHFNTVEINASFYHQMSAKTFAKWRQITPKNFIFSVKISRFLTHIKKLNNSKEPWQRFINNAKMLKEKLGPILVQLPPRFKANKEKLEDFLKITPKKYKLAFEFRDKSWFDKEILQILKKYNATLVFADFKGVPVVDEITADFIYIRMHGPADLYSSKYTAGQLQKLADKINRWKKEVKEIYVYFNNDTEGYALENAKTLIKLAR
ncbi:MAG: DUF72 domain-containing protein [Patescibacteria group bacterium]|nr:DUF72 domain-containing protein [Patescibacteria group bacterium]